MTVCFCTGACMRGEGCAARPAWRTQQIPPMPLTQVVTDSPLTEERVRQILREELARAKDGDAA